MPKTLEEQQRSCVFRTSGKGCSRLRLPLGEGKFWRLRLSKTWFNNLIRQDLKTYSRAERKLRPKQL